MVEEQIIQELMPSNLREACAPIVRSPIRKEWVKMQVASQIIHIAAQKLGSYARAVKTLRALKKNYQEIFGEPLLNKIAEVDGRYYWRLAAPGFPSPASRQLHHNELNRLLGRYQAPGLRVLFLAITKKCPLHCRHCFEWDRLHQPEKLSVPDLISIVRKYQDYGTTQIMLSGGEPMLRLPAVFQLLEKARPETNFWIITTGTGLNAEQAGQLKRAGLTGVMVSLDHHDPGANNEIRGHERAYEWAVEGVHHAREAGLVTALSLCATTEFVSAENLAAYLELARQLGVVFVQLNEIRPAGPYQSQIGSLSAEQRQLLETIYLTYNADPGREDYPIINYTGYHQRRVGCFGGGDQFLYIDSDGDVHICPFCDEKICHALAFPVRDTIALLQEHACHVFQRAPHQVKGDLIRPRASIPVVSKSAMD